MSNIFSYHTGSGLFSPSPLRKRSLARRRLSRAWGAGAGAASVGVSRRHANTADRARMTD